MPELPDVAGFKNHIEQRALNRRISEVSVRDNRFIKGCEVRHFQQTLEKQTFKEVDQRGKFLFLHLNEGQWLVLHFGMTGEPCCYDGQEEPPRFERVAFVFDDGRRLGISCMRMLGRASLTEEKQSFIEQEKLGPHALDDQFTETDFVSLFSGRRGAVKSALMNQQLIAGIGNIYADEILLQTGIHPQSAVKSLDDQTLRRLYDVMQDVLAKAAHVGGDQSRLPSDYLVPLRGGKEISCPVCGRPITYKKVGGRGAYFCPNCQKQT